MSVSRHTAYNLVGSALPILLALATVPVYLRLVGPDRYGVLAIAWLLLGYFGLFDLGLGRATSFRVSALREAAPQARTDTFLAAVSVNAGMGVVGGCVLWGVSWLFFERIFRVEESLRSEILSAVPLLALGVPIATLTGVLTGALQGRERFFEINLVSATSTALFQLLPLFVAWQLGPNLVGLLLAAVLARVLALGALAALCHREFVRFRSIRIVWDEVPNLMKYGGWVLVSAVVGPVLVIVDRFAIGALLGAQSVAAYTVPFQLAQRIQILPAALTNSLFPRMSSASGPERSAMFHRATLVLSSLLTPPAIVALYGMAPFLDLWIGRDLAEIATPIARILVLGFWANAFALVVFMRLQSGGRPDLVSKMLLFQIPPYLMALYFGMTMWGLPGSAMAFSLRCVVDYFLLNLVGGRDFRALPVLSVGIALLAAATLATSTWPALTWPWWGSAVVLGLLSFLLAWRTLPEEGRVLLRRLIRFQRETRGGNAGNS